MIRTGFGYDAHRFGGVEPLRLGGVEIPGAPGVRATSDGDVAAHALIDAVFGACALGDIGEHFPSGDGRFDGADSMALLRRAAEMATAAGFDVHAVDVTVVSQDVRIAPYRSAMCSQIAAALGLDIAQVSVKATTTDGIGGIGRGEGIAAAAVATVTQR